ncbi:hypothetical protein THRCLA_01848 [Thraustotheca clavata]|uniref:Uncharacterized protein n=1 Tax=Thraustotheca clavata TaxID=74557 RepID=A0A1W0A730_9STRA|nr:hypothetical protein THRCLA_01848 [Thraustotheca clavata]
MLGENIKGCLQVIEIAAQSYQAWALSYYATDLTLVFAYTTCIAINSLFSPILLFTRIGFVHVPIRLFINGILGFTVTTIFPLFTIVPIFLQKRLLPASEVSQLRNNPIWLTHTILYTRVFSASSPFALFVKITMGFLNFMTLRQLAQSVLRQCVVKHKGPQPNQIRPSTEKALMPNGPSIANLLCSGALKRNSSRILTLSQLPQSRYWNFRTSMATKALCFMLWLWGIILVIASVLLLYQSDVCPEGCLLSVTPLFYNGCHCIYFQHSCLDVECDITHFVSPDRIGSLVYYLEIHHCPLTDGVPKDVFKPFASLFALRILFSNMSTFSTPIPDSLTRLEIRYSQLQVVPTMLSLQLPPHLIYLALEGNLINDIPQNVLRSWQQIEILHLAETNVNDITFDNIINELPNLRQVSLYATKISTIPPNFFNSPSLQSAYLSSNDNFCLMKKLHQGSISPNVGTTLRTAFKLRAKLSLVSSSNSMTERSDETIQALKDCSYYPILIFCVIKHTFACIYNMVLILLILNISPAELRVIGLFSKPCTIANSTVFVLAHGYGTLDILVQLFLNCRLNKWVSLFRTISQQWRQCQKSRVFTCCLQVLEIVVQSYQVWRLSFCITNRTMVLAFIVCIIINSILSPWLLFSRVGYIHVPVRLFINGILGFTVTVMIPLLAFLPVLLQRKSLPPVQASQLRNDPFWLTSITLYTRVFSSTTALGILIKITLDTLNFLTLRQLFQSVLRHHSNKRRFNTKGPRIHQIRPAHLDNADKGKYTEAVRRNFNRVLFLTHLPQAKYWNFHSSLATRFLCFTLWLWGVVLSVASVLLISQNGICPKGCLLSVTPLFRSGCHCIYFQHSCWNNLSNISRILTLNHLGPVLYYVELSHCSLLDDVPQDILMPFTSLFALRVLFTNMSTFSTTIPDSLMRLEIRYSQLQFIPELLTKNLPPNLLHLAIEGNFISDIPLDILHSWRQIQTLHFAETLVNDTTFENIMSQLINLREISLYKTRISTIPEKFFHSPNLQSAYLSSNAISVPQGLPSSITSPLILLDLTCNPIDKMQLWPNWIVQEATNKFCETNYCSPALLTNQLCDVPCNSVLFDFDANACTPYNK